MADKHTRGRPTSRVTRKLQIETTMTGPRTRGGDTHGAVVTSRPGGTGAAGSPARRSWGADGAATVGGGLAAPDKPDTPAPHDPAVTLHGTGPAGRNLTPTETPAGCHSSFPRHCRTQKRPRRPSRGRESSAAPADSGALHGAEHKLAVRPRDDGHVPTRSSRPEKRHAARLGSAMFWKRHGYGHGGRPVATTAGRGRGELWPQATHWSKPTAGGRESCGLTKATGVRQGRCVHTGSSATTSVAQWPACHRRGKPVGGAQRLSPLRVPAPLKLVS